MTTGKGVASDLFPNSLAQSDFGNQQLTAATRMSVCLKKAATWADGKTWTIAGDIVSTKSPRWGSALLPDWHDPKGHRTWTRNSHIGQHQRMPEILSEYCRGGREGIKDVNGLSHPKNVSSEVVGNSMMGSAGEKRNRLCRWLQHLQNIQLQILILNFFKFSKSPLGRSFVPRQARWKELLQSGWSIIIMPRLWQIHRCFKGQNEE